MQSNIEFADSNRLGEKVWVIESPDNRKMGISILKGFSSLNAKFFFHFVENSG